MREKSIFGRKSRRESPYYKNIVIFTSNDGKIEAFDSLARLIFVKGGHYNYWCRKIFPFKFKNKGMVAKERIEIVECIDLYGDLIKVQ